MMKAKIKIVIFWIIFSILYLLQATIKGACDWYNIRFGVSFEEILFTITSPLAGADVSFLNEAVSFTLPYIFKATFQILLFMLGTSIFYIICINFRVCIAKIQFSLNARAIYKLLCLICAISFLFTSLNYTVTSLSLDTYVSRRSQPTTIYEDYYVDPSTVSITCDGKPKNLIYIYIESLETTYASENTGGSQKINYIPNLTQLAKENTSFSDTKLLGGAYVSFGATWTMGALFATTTGIPFSFPIEGNSMGKMEIFAPGVTSLGDILNKFGYTQKFLCGSDGTFAGRKSYFEQHGNYEVLDYYYAIDKGYIDEDYYVWWGYEDAILYDIAKVELLKLADSDEPFNFTMLTVDTHHVDGYICEKCDDTYDEQLGNVLECADRQIFEFIEWCQKQDFYNDTVIVITGDHFRMDSSLVSEAGPQGTRRLYNCIINSEKIAKNKTTNRIFTSLDFFPTTLSAMGYTIEGNRLGLGTDLYSKTKTLSEELTYPVFNEELGKYSNFYVETFQ